MRFACVCSVFVFFTVLLLLLCCCLLLCFVHSGRALFFIERAVYLCVVCVSVSFSCAYFIEKETKPVETKTPGTLPPSVRSNSLPPSVRANSLPPSLRANSLPPSLTSDVSVCFIVDCLYARNLCFLLLFYLCLRANSLPPSLRANSLPPSLRANSLPPSLTSDVSVCFIVDCLYAGNLCFLLLFYLCLLISELSFSFCLLRTLLFPVFFVLLRFCFFCVFCCWHCLFS